MSNEFRPKYAGIGRSSHSTGTSTNTAQAGWTVAGSRSTARQNRFRLDDYLNEASRENRVQEGWGSRGGDWGTDDWGTNDGWDNDWAAESGWGTAGDWDAGVTSRSTPGGVPPEEDRKCLGCQRIFGDAKGLLSHRDGSPNTANRFTCEAESCSFASCSLSGLRNHHRTLGHGAEIPSVSTDSIDSFPPLGSSTPSSGASRSSTGVSSNSSTSATNTWAEISAPRRARIGHSTSTTSPSDTRTRGSAVNFNTATPRVSSANTPASTPASTSSTRPSGPRTRALLFGAPMTRCEQCLQLMRRADLEQHVIDFHPAIECWGCSKGFKDEDGLLQHHTCGIPLEKEIIYNCPCGESFSNRKAVLRHILDDDQQLEHIGFCFHCEVIFEHMSDYLCHQERLHDTPYPENFLTSDWDSSSRSATPTPQDRQTAIQKEKQPLQQCNCEGKVALTCIICLGFPEKLTATGCGHIYCNECIVSSLRMKNECPACRKRTTASELREIFI